jgi:hypothetical protein
MPFSTHEDPYNEVLFSYVLTPELLTFYVLKSTLHLLLVSPPSFAHNCV